MDKWKTYRKEFRERNGMKEEYVAVTVHVLCVSSKLFSRFHLMCGVTFPQSTGMGRETLDLRTFKGAKGLALGFGQEEKQEEATEWTRCTELREGLDKLARSLYELFLDPSWRTVAGDALEAEEWCAMQQWVDRAIRNERRLVKYNILRCSRQHGRLWPEEPKTTYAWGRSFSITDKKMEYKIHDTPMHEMPDSSVMSKVQRGAQLDGGKALSTEMDFHKLALELDKTSDPKVQEALHNDMEAALQRVERGNEKLIAAAQEQAEKFHADETGKLRETEAELWQPRFNTFGQEVCESARYLPPKSSGAFDDPPVHDARDRAFVEVCSDQACRRTDSCAERSSA